MNPHAAGYRFLDVVRARQSQSRWARKCRQSWYVKERCRI